MFAIFRNRLFFKILVICIANSNNKLLLLQAKPYLDEELYEKLLIDPRAQFTTLYTTFLGGTIGRISSFFSIFGSSIIIFVILRSSIKLRNPYHRMMFGKQSLTCIKKKYFYID